MNNKCMARMKICIVLRTKLKGSLENWTYGYNSLLKRQMKYFQGMFIWCRQNITARHWKTFEYNVVKVSDCLESSMK
jgi:hypothetical protein